MQYRQYLGVVDYPGGGIGASPKTELFDEFVRPLEHDDQVGDHAF